MIKPPPPKSLSREKHAIVIIIRAGCLGSPPIHFTTRFLAHSAPLLLAPACPPPAGL